MTSYGDWSNEEYYERTKDVPDSCCVNVTKGCGKNVRANMATVRNLQEHRNGPGQINQPHHQNEPLQHHQEREDRVFSSHRIMKRDEADTEVHITKNLYTDVRVDVNEKSFSDNNAHVS